jgi:glycosyltransferase involved in cell wall biosynthesis
MKKYKISVVMCTYNGSKYLQEQLDSIALQNRLPDELIVCDDCSTDATLDILFNFQKTAPFSVIIQANEYNIGTGKNFEGGVRASSGEIILLSDQDDVWYPYKISKMEECFLANDSVEAIFADSDVVNGSLKKLGYTFWESMNFNSRQQALFKNGCSFELLVKKSVVAGATLAFKRKCIEYILPIPSKVNYDAWIAIMISIFGNIIPLKQSLNQYRQHDSNQIGGIKKNELQKIQTIKTQRKRLIEEDIYYYNCLKKNIEELSFCFENKDQNTILQNKISHLCTRNELPKSFFERFFVIMTEIFKLRYSKYSYSSKAAIGDLLIFQD